MYFGYWSLSIPHITLRQEVYNLGETDNESRHHILPNWNYYIINILNIESLRTMCVLPLPGMIEDTTLALGDWWNGDPTRTAQF